MSNNHRVSCGTHTNHRNPLTDESFKRDDIVLRVCGQVRKLSGSLNVLTPTREVLIDGSRVVEIRLRPGHLVDTCAIHVVTHTDGDLLEAGQHIEFGEHIVSDAVNAGCVTSNRRVKPPGPARTPRGRAKFVATIAQPVTRGILQLGRERPRAHPGGVRLHNSHNGGQAPRGDPRSGGSPSGSGIRGGHKWIGPMIHIQHRGLSTLKQHGFVSVQRSVELQRRIGHHGAQSIAVD